MADKGKVAIVALSDYSRLYNGECESTVDKWMEKAKNEWTDRETGLVASFLAEYNDSARIVLPVKGSYSALNCYYPSLIDPEFAGAER